MSLPLEPALWQGDINGCLLLIDQTRLPNAIEFLECVDVDQVWIAIQELSVRGAPAIGIAAAFGVCLGAQAALDADLPTMRTSISRWMPLCVRTASRAISMSASTSAALAPPTLAMKLAWSVENAAPPTR